MAEKKKKVLFVATVDSHIELFHLPYLKMFHDKGWEVHVATDTGKKIKYCDKKIKLPIKRSPFKLVSNYKAMRKLREVMKKEGYSIVHCHTPMGGVVARMAGRKLRRQGQRMIYTAHGFHFYKGAPVHYWLMFYPVEWYLAKYTDTLITINDEDYERAKRKFSRRCRDIQYVPGVGVDEKKFEKKLSTKEKHVLRESLGLKDDDKVLICVGRLDKNKNQGFLIRAMKGLIVKDEKYQLLLVGPDELNGKYQKLADKLGVSEHVKFLGFRKDIPELLQISGIAVSSSKREGLPVNLIEAAMVGLPIVATDCRGVRDICKAVDGAVFQQNDYMVFAKNILDSRQRLGKTRRPKEFFDINVHGIINKIYYRKKRVLHVLASNHFSGAENVVCTIIKTLSNEFDMAYCSPNGPIREELNDRNVRFFGINKLRHKELKRIVNDYDPDFIHAHDFRASCVAGMLKGRFLVISHIHKDDPTMRRVTLKSVLYLFFSRRMFRIVGVSDSVLREYIFKSFISDKYITIFNYVDKDEVISRAKEFIISKKYDLFFLGRLSEEKNPLGFIEIVKMLNNEELRCVMIGDGPLYADCKRLISHNNLEDSIEMVGFQKNPYPYVNSSKIGIMPSKYEGFGLAAIEATILGKPVINSGVGGLSSIYENTNLIAHNKAEYKEILLNKHFMLPKINIFLDKNVWLKLLHEVYDECEC